MFPKKNREITGKNTSKDVSKTLISFIFLFDLDNFINNKTKLLPRRQRKIFKNKERKFT